LDLPKFYASYEEKDGRGQAAYHPVMMVRLLIYGYCIGVVSSRQIEKRTYEDVAFRYLSADEHPDHTTTNEFRKRHLKALAELFLQALQLCQAAGLVKMGHVALDGTKKQAKASICMSLPDATSMAPVEETAPSADAVKAATAQNQMKQKLQTEAGHAIYEMRKAIVEPVFGQIKECRNFRRFSLRSLET
jgi:transposase